MFNLEQSIAEWRRHMTVGGIKSREVLDELESHLCEDVDQRMRSDMNTEQALKEAVQRIGNANKLKKEFERIENRERKYMKRGLIIGAGIIGVLVGMAFVMPAVAQYQHEGAMSHGEPWLFALGIALTLGGCGAAFRGLKRHRA